MGFCGLLPPCAAAPPAHGPHDVKRQSAAHGNPYAGFHFVSHLSKQKNTRSFAVP